MKRIKLVIYTANIALVGAQVGEAVYAYHADAPMYLGIEAPSSPHTDPELPQAPVYLGAFPAVETSASSSFSAKDVAVFRASLDDQRSDVVLLGA